MRETRKAKQRLRKLAVNIARIAKECQILSIDIQNSLDEESALLAKLSSPALGQGGLATFLREGMLHERNKRSRSGFGDV